MVSPSQLVQIRQKLIEPLQLKVDTRHSIEDTYPGFWFRLRDIRKEIELRANEYGDPNSPVLLLAGSLDCIRCKGLECETYCAQFHEKGMRILTTDPTDDDSRTVERIPEKKYPHTDPHRSGTSESGYSSDQRSRSLLESKAAAKQEPKFCQSQNSEST